MTLQAVPLASMSALEDVEVVLEECFESKAALVRANGSHYARLWNEARIASRGGKRLRPAILVHTHQTLSGRHDRAAAVVAAAYELLHTAYLMHDDVIDGDTFRRGRSNVSGTFRDDAVRDSAVKDAGVRWGDAAGILGGDLLLHCAQRLIATLDAPTSLRRALLDVLDEAMFVTAAGELYDVAYSEEVVLPGLAEVLAASQRKTAHYSFVAPLVSAALLAEADDAIAPLSEFGLHTGTAFQLRDDLLGVFGDESVTGKPASGDLRRGAVTPLMCFGMQTAWGDELRDIVHQSRCDAEDLARARELLRRCGAVEFVESLIEESVHRADASLGSDVLPQPLRDYLRSVAHQAGARAA
jgi:geranylgeranyl diphosphate synthase type II